MITEILVSILVLLTNYLLILACCLLSGSYYRSDSCVQKFGHATIYYYFCIVSVGQLIGLFGLLTPWLFILIVTIFSISLLLFLMHIQGAHLKVIFKGFFIFGLNDSLFLTGIFGFLFFYIFLFGIGSFPHEWDALMYHLPYVDQWVLSENLSSKNCWMWSNPGNNELFAFWLIGPFSGDFYYFFNNIPALILTVCGIFEILRAFRVPPIQRSLLVIGIVGNYLFVYQLQQAMNDISVVGLYLCSVGYLLRIEKNKRFINFVGFSISVGLISGIKYYALGYSVTLFFIFAIENAQIFKIKKKHLIRVAFCGLLVLAGCGSWYIRNFFITGYPLFPLGAPIEEESITNFYPNIFRSTFIGNGSDQLYPLFLKAVFNVGGILQFLSVVFIPLSITTIFYIYSISKKKSSLKAYIICFFSLFGSLAIFLITPFAVESEPGTLNQLKWEFCPVRYGFCFISLSSVFFGLMIWESYKFIYKIASRKFIWLSKNIPRYLANFFLFLFYTNIYFVSFYVADYKLSNNFSGNFLASIMCVLLIIIFFLYIRIIIGRILTIVLFFCFFSLIFIAISPYAAYKWHTEFQTYYDSSVTHGCIQFIKMEVKKNDKICILDYRMYPFFSSRREFNVFQIPPMKSTTWWKSNVNKLNIQFIVLRLYPKSSINNWNHLLEYFNGEKIKFERCFDVPGEFVIFKVRCSL